MCGSCYNKKNPDKVLLKCVLKAILNFMSLVAWPCIQTIILFVEHDQKISFGCFFGDGHNMITDHSDNEKENLLLS